MKIDVPCNVGDVVYQIDKSRQKIETKKVVRISIDICRDNLCAIFITFATFGFCIASDFGKTVFHDYAEAMHTLNEHLNRERT